MSMGLVCAKPGLDGASREAASTLHKSTDRNDVFSAALGRVHHDSGLVTSQWA